MASNPAFVQIASNFGSAFGFRVNLPRPDLIPVPSVRSAFEKLLARTDRMNRLVTERGIAERDLANARSVDSARSLELADQGEDNPAPHEHEVEAAAALAHIAAQIEPAIAAQQQAFGELLATIREHRDEWRKASEQKADSAINRAVAAHRTLTEVAAELDAHVGTIELLDRLDAPGEHPLAMRQPSSAFDLEQARTSLSDAIRKSGQALGGNR